MVQYVVDEIHLGFVAFPKIHAALCSKNTSMLTSPPAKKIAMNLSYQIFAILVPSVLKWYVFRGSSNQNQ